MSHPQGDAAMTFDEIAARLGVSHQAVSQTFSSAMRKLRRKPHVMAYLRSLQHDVDESRYPSLNHTRHTKARKVPA